VYGRPFISSIPAAKDAEYFFDFRNLQTAVQARLRFLFSMCPPPTFFHAEDFQRRCKRVLRP
jgi:hypothetical protein